MRSRPGHWFRGRSFRICSGRKRQRRRRRRRARPFGHRRVRSLRENTGNTVVNASFKSKAKRGTGCAQRGCLFIVLSQHRDPGGKKRKCFFASRPVPVQSRQSRQAAAEEEERKQRPWSPGDSEEKSAVVVSALGGRTKMPGGANAKTTRSGHVARTTLRQAREALRRSARCAPSFWASIALRSV